MTIQWDKYQLMPGVSGLFAHKTHGRECEIHISPRPHYCDRGNFVATISTTGKLALELDSQDGWPRYYFDLDRAKLEIEAWIIKRKQLPLGDGAGS